MPLLPARIKVQDVDTPEDFDPIVLQEPTREGISVLGSLDAMSGSLITKITDSYNALTFMEFLTDIPTGGKETHFVLDNAKYHHATVIREFVEKYPDIILEFLPPCSPELNAIERVWKLIRKMGTHNRYFPSIGNLVYSLNEQFSTYRTPNDTLKRLCAIN